MKAKDYAQMFEDFLKDPKPVWEGKPDDAPPGDDLDLLTDAATYVCLAMAREVKEIAAVRKATRPEALASIMKEQIQKWQAVCRLLPQHLLPPDFFMSVAKAATGVTS